ncbi:MAG: hypothetical protein ACNA8H_03510 [Anaerolineales bacterium]
MTTLLLADSGYGPANPPEWINNLRPQLVLLSVAAGDALDLPSPETMEALQGYSLLRTDLKEWIHLSTDGEQLWVEVALVPGGTVAPSGEGWLNLLGSPQSETPGNRK